MLPFFPVVVRERKPRRHSIKFTRSNDLADQVQSCQEGGDHLPDFGEVEVWRDKRLKVDVSVVRYHSAISATAHLSANKCRQLTAAGWSARGIQVAAVAVKMCIRTKEGLQERDGVMRRLVKPIGSLLGQPVDKWRSNTWCAFRVQVSNGRVRGIDVSSRRCIEWLAHDDLNDGHVSRQQAFLELDIEAVAVQNGTAAGWIIWREVPPLAGSIALLVLDC